MGNQNNTTGGSPTIVQPTMGPGSIFNMGQPPVTTDEKKLAQDQLMEDLQQIANYPEGNIENKGPSIIQNMFRSNAPRGLYLTLSKYYDNTISHTPHGDELLSYKRGYYAFEQDAKLLDEQLLAKVGVLSQSAEPYQWVQYLRYCISRETGHSEEEIKRAGGPSSVPNFDTAENVCKALRLDPEVGVRFVVYSQSVSVFDAVSQSILRLYR